MLIPILVVCSPKSGIRRDEGYSGGREQKTIITGVVNIHQRMETRKT